jgi:hypothetical protein
MSASETTPPSSGVDVCPACHAPFVHPVDWTEHDGSWLIWLRCAECWLEREVVLSDDVAGRFGEDVERGIEVIADALAELDAERMTRQADAFAAALQLDLIDAADFGA